MAERLEDVFTEVLKKFPSTQHFKKFAQSGNGLSLSVQDVTAITEDNRFSVEEQKQQMLGLWKERNGANATPQRIRHLVEQYYVAEQQVVAPPDGRLEDVFQEILKRFSPREFKQFARSGRGLSLTEYQVSNITEDNKTSIEEQNLKMLWEWRYIRYPNTDIAAVVERIRQLVDVYKNEPNQAEGQQIIQEEEDRMLGSPPKVSKKHIQPNKVSKTEEFLEIVHKHVMQMVEVALKYVKKNMNSDEFLLPVVTKFDESKSNKQAVPIDFKNIFSDNSADRIMLLGATGSGKTTLALICTLLALQKKLNVSQDIKMVYFIDVSDLQRDERSTPFDLLFIQQLGSKLPKKLHGIAREWFEKHFASVLFVIDGLDRSLKEFGDKYPRIGLETLADANTVLANIMSSHIYDGMKVLSTTRHHTYWLLHPDQKAQKTCTLGGFDVTTLNFVAKNLFGSERMIDDLKQKAPDLVSKPMFLSYMARVLKDSRESVVDTITNLMVSVLRCFSGSHHGGRHLVTKLMKLAFHGIKDNRFVFTARYIDSLNLDMSDMRGLVEMDADTRFVEYVADNDDMRIRFPHQSLQEILASLYACTLGLDEFKNFVEKNISKARKKIIVKHIFGIVLNESTSEKAAKYVSDDLHAKYQYLLGYLDKILEGNVISDVRVVVMLHECGPDVIKKVCSKIQDIKLNNFLQLMKPEDQHAVMSFAGHIRSLRSLQLCRLKIHPENYTFLQHVFCLAQNMQSDFFSLINCDPDVDKLRILNEAMKKGNVKIEWFEIRRSPALEPAGYYHVMGMVHHSCASEFAMDGCDLNADKIEKMNEATVEYNVKLKGLYTDGDSEMDEAAFQQLAKLLGNTEAKSLSALDCTPTNEQLSALCTSLEKEDIKLVHLYLRRSGNSFNNNELLMLSVLALRVEWLYLYGLVLNKSQLTFLTKETRKRCPEAEVLDRGSWGFLVKNSPLFR